MTALQTRTLSALPAPDVLQLLAHLADSTTGDIALLHSPALSVLGCNPLSTFQVPSSQTADPFDKLLHHLNSFILETARPLLGWMGFISYDVGRTLESIPAHTPDDPHWPLLHWQLFSTYFLFDHAAKTLSIHTVGFPAPDPAPVAEFVQKMPAHPLPSKSILTFLSHQPKKDFTAKVQRVKEYIADGHIYQANLAQRWIVQTSDKPHDIFHRLCNETPAPYAAYLRFRHNNARHYVLSASPELFLALDNGHLTTRPIKGTRPRYPDDSARDSAARDELLASAKDQAELAMIVDLLRNDLGRVSEFGSVEVPHARLLEQHPTVWHTVATIESRLRENATLADLLRATCPGGSITGAPKIRAMQIIEELEGFRRGLYCGNIGVIGPDRRSLALNIAIRTIQMVENTAYVHAGAGIVADSDPEKEYEETLHKAAALLRALGVE